ncbi:MAG: N,N'-diacetylchitobiose phosphorylase [Oscillospiraceae bacterium]|jgi:N,N'-diacetylchitobiose phosphorylase|nr:N,N'-diacetylchitobiose phosphorylase [Oscillospiraceae bacterium]
MHYGNFDDMHREYEVERPDVPVSWTNYLGTQDTCAVLSHNAGGYLFHGSPQYGRITRFRQNGVPLDRPGHYVYIRDAADGDYWSVSWQPVGKPLHLAAYTCRHGLSYSRYLCDYRGIHAQQVLFIPWGDAVELWDVILRNDGSTARVLDVFTYCELSFHHIDMDNQNLQMSLYATGADYANGIIQHDLFYEEFGYQYFAASPEPDDADCVRDAFLGDYRTESNPLAVERGACSGSAELGGNHCAATRKRVVLQPGESTRLIYMLGEGDRAAGLAMRKKYSDTARVDAAFAALADYWAQKLARLQVDTPNPGMNTMLNTWNPYQAETNVTFSRFASFVEVGGRTGLGYRDTAQDVMCVPHTNPEKCRQRIIELLRGLTRAGYGLHLFDPAWFEPAAKQQAFKSPTVVPTPDAAQMVHGLKDACSDDALWLVPAICEYVKETGELALFDQTVTYADGGEGDVWEHLRKILAFSAEQVGENGICKGLRADWNDCLNLGGGQSAMVSFLHHWALDAFAQAARFLGRDADAGWAEALMAKVRAACQAELWDGDWYIRGITAKGAKIGTSRDVQGKVHLESNTWAVISGVADAQRGRQCMDAVDAWLYTPWGLQLNAPAYDVPNDDIGFITRVYKGVKENGAIFSHPNPWAWVAEAKLGRGSRAMKFYDALLPYNQNDRVEVRQAEPYSYCQFVMGREHSAHGRARHPWLTGSAGWAYFAATHYLLGIRPGFGALDVDPCIPADWQGFSITRVWRGATFHIRVENPHGVEKGVASILLDGQPAASIPPQAPGSEHTVRVVMG